MPRLLRDTRLQEFCYLLGKEIYADLRTLLVEADVDILQAVAHVFRIKEYLFQVL